MKLVLKKIWRILLLFWTVIGAAVSVILLVGLVSLLTSKSFQKLSPGDFCKQNQIGSNFKAMEISLKIQNVKRISATLSSPIGSVKWSGLSSNEKERESAEKILLEIDKQGLKSTFHITDSLGFLKRTCEIEFENGAITRSNYSTWD